MFYLYNCKGEVVAKYRTIKGLKIGIGRRWRALWVVYETTPVSERKQYNMIYYTECAA